MPRQRKFLWLSVDRLTRFVAALISGALVARALPPEQYGLLAQALLLFSVLDAVASLGLPSVIGTRVAVSSIAMRDRVLTRAAMMRVAASMTFSLALIATSTLTGEKFIPLEITLIAAAGVTVSNWMLLDGYFQGCDQPELGAVCKCLVAIIFVLVRLWHVEVGTPTVTSLFAIFCVEQIVMTALMLATLWWQKRRRATNSVAETVAGMDGKILRYALNMWIGQVLTLAYMRADQFLLSAQGERELLAKYAVASQLAEYSFTLSIVFQAVYVGKIGALRQTYPLANIDTEMEKIYRSGFTVSLLLCLFACVSAHWLVPAIYGAQYMDAVVLFQILIWMAPLTMLGTLQNLVVFTGDKPESYLKRVAIAAALSVPISFLGFALGGVHGLAVSSLLIQLLACFALNFFFDKSSFKTQFAAVSIWKFVK